MDGRGKSGDWRDAPQSSFVSGFVTRGALIAMSQMGVDPDALCARSHVDRELVMNATTRVPRDAVWALFNHAAKLTGNPSLGLAVAKTPQGRAVGGVLRQISDVSDTGESALMNLAKYHKIIADGLDVFVRGEADRVDVELVPAEPDVELIRHAMECLVALIWKAVVDAITEPFAPVRVSFPHRSPSDTSPYQAFFGCSVEFGGEGYVLELPGEPLRREMIGREPAVAARLEEVAERQLRAIAPAFVNAVGEQIRAAIRARERPTRAHVAKRMGLGERTLGRRLESEGSSFRSVVDETRCELARPMLRAGQLSISEIAQAIGFEDSTSFTKAFRRWTGENPSAYRDRSRAE